MNKGRVSLWLIVAMAMFSIIGVNVAQQEQLSVWHSWHDQDADFLNGVGETYAGQMGVSIEFKEFATEAELTTNLLTAYSAGKAPDIVLANHVTGTVLLNGDVLGGYCIDERGPCGVCFSGNPPEWCLYAQGLDFSHGQISDFLMSTAYCAPDGCPECQLAVPPPWCRFAMGESDLKIDVLQASVIIPSIEGLEPFPYGIPIWWEYLDIYVRPDVFEQQDLTVPTTIDELQSIIHQTGQVAYDFSRFDVSGVALPQDPIPVFVADLLPFSLPQDPVPYDQALIIIASSQQFGALQDRLGALESLTLEGYQPLILSHNGYMTMQSRSPEAALNFMYFLSDEATQVALYEATGHLPANGEILAQVMDSENMAQLIKSGFDGKLLYPFVGEAQAVGQIAVDQIGIVSADGISIESVIDFVAQFDLQLVDILSPEIAIFSVPGALTQEELVSLARRIKSEGQDVIAQAGLVLTPSGAETPMILTDEFIAQFRPEVTDDEVKLLSQRYGVEMLEENPLVENQFLLAVTENSRSDLFSIVRLFEQSGLVEYAEPNFVKVVDYRQAEVTPNDPLFANQWQHRNTTGAVDGDIDTTWAWSITQGEPRIIIAIIDNGFDVNHEDLAPNAWVNPGEIAGNGNDDDGNGFIDDINGWDFTANSGVITVADHGTAVAGMAAARGNNNIGVIGSCPNCRIMFIRNGNNDFTSAQAFDYARRMGAQIITNSWGFAIGTPCGTTLCAAINTAATTGRGGLGSVVLFASNNPNVNDCVGINPDISSLPTVIAVTRLNIQDSFDMAGFGNCVDIMAPGRDVLTTDIMGAGGSSAGNYAARTGTSFSTPLTAGVVGLILTVNPNLTRQEVQRLLQDTTDKVQSSTGGYAENTGFSVPAGGQATHTFGRLNSFEVVRVAASTAGGRAGVDVFIRDNRLDWGNTEQPSNLLFESPRGYIPHWESADIKIDAFPYAASAPTTPAAFDAFVNENPISSQVNRVYVRVHNRGTRPATNVDVTLHWTFASTAMPALPGNFWTDYKTGAYSGPNWNFIGAHPVSNLQPSGASFAGCPTRLAPDCLGGSDSAQIVRFDWTGPTLDPALPAFRHFCLFVVIDSSQDGVATASKSLFVPDNITPMDNNVTHRNVLVQDPQVGRKSTVFYVRNPFDHVIRTRLGVTTSDPRGLDTWGLEFEGLSVNEPFTLQAGEEILVTVSAALPADVTVGRLTVTQFMLEEKSERVLGGLTIEFYPPNVEVDLPDDTVSLMWLNHLDLLPGDSTVSTSYSSTSSGVGGGLAGLVIESTTAGDTDSYGGIKVVHMALDIPPNYSVEGVRVCYELSSRASYITQVRLDQVQDPPSSAIVYLDDGTDLIAPGPVCVDTSTTVINPADGAILLSLRVNFTAPSDRIVIRGVGVYLKPMP